MRTNMSDEAQRDTEARASASAAACPCEEGRFCDASCACRCAEGLCGDCEQLSGEERGYCSCADGGKCAGGEPHALWLADFDHWYDALFAHPDLQYAADGYVQRHPGSGAPAGATIPWTDAVQVVEVGSPADRRFTLIPIWQEVWYEPDNPLAAESPHCPELTDRGFASLCGQGHAGRSGPERQPALWGAGAIACAPCRALLTKDA